MFNFFSEGGFMLTDICPNNLINDKSITNYVNQDISNNMYDIPAYDTESSLVIY